MFGKYLSMNIDQIHGNLYFSRSGPTAPLPPMSLPTQVGTGWSSPRSWWTFCAAQGWDCFLRPLFFNIFPSAQHFAESFFNRNHVGKNLYGLQVSMDGAYFYQFPEPLANMLANIWWYTRDVLLLFFFLGLVFVSSLGLHLAFGFSAFGF